MLGQNPTRIQGLGWRVAAQLAGGPPHWPSPGAYVFLWLYTSSTGPRRCKAECTEQRDCCGGRSKGEGGAAGEAGSERWGWAPRTAAAVAVAAGGSCAGRRRTASSLGLGFYFLAEAVTLNFQCTMSPSCTSYVLPSCRHLPAALTAAVGAAGEAAGRQQRRDGRAVRERGRVGSCQSGGRSRTQGSRPLAQPALHQPPHLHPSCRFKTRGTLHAALTRLGAVLLHILECHDFSTDETTLKVGVDGARRLGRLGVLPDLPAPHLQSGHVVWGFCVCEWAKRGGHESRATGSTGTRLGSQAGRSGCVPSEPAPSHAGWPSPSGGSLPSSPGHCRAQYWHTLTSCTPAVK